MYNSTAKCIYLTAYQKQFKIPHTSDNVYIPYDLASEIESIQAYTKNMPSKSVFIGPSSPFLYTFFSYTNPTRYTHLDPGLHNDLVLQEITASIDSKKTEFIIFLPTKTAFYTYKPNTYTPNPLTMYLTKHYEPVLFLGKKYNHQPIELNDAIWKRKD